MIKVITLTKDYAEVELNKLYKEGWKIISSSSVVKEESYYAHGMTSIVKHNVFYLTYTLEKPDEVITSIPESSEKKLESGFDAFINHMCKCPSNPVEYSLTYLYSFWKQGCGDMDIPQLDFQCLLTNNSEKNHKKYLIINDSHRGICVLFHKPIDTF